MSKKTGIANTKPLIIKPKEAFFSPVKLTAARTIRSAAPLSSMHLPMIAAIAITIPIAPAAVPNALTTAFIRPPRSSPVVAPTNRLTTRAEIISARNALSLRPMISPKTETIPMITIAMGHGSTPALAAPSSVSPWLSAPPIPIESSA